MEIWEELGYETEFEYLFDLLVQEASKSDNYYVPSCANRDHNPSNPWDAPEMSIKDFI